MAAVLLIVEDDLTLQKVISGFLKDEGYITQTASTGSDALAKLEKAQPSLVLLDLGLPDIQGETVLAKIREDYPGIPVIILTAKAETHEIAAGLNLGADDYLPKPFAAEELLARINARLRKQEVKDKLTVDELVLDLTKMVAIRKGREIELTKTEFQLLEFLMKNRGRILTRDTILNHVWGYSSDVESRVVDIYIGYLRKKIDNGNIKKLIKNKRGFGYMIDA